MHRVAFARAGREEMVLDGNHLVPDPRSPSGRPARALQSLGLVRSAAQQDCLVPPGCSAVI